jgi:hypothetical protein
LWASGQATITGTQFISTGLALIASSVNVQGSLFQGSSIQAGYAEMTGTRIIGGGILLGGSTPADARFVNMLFAGASYGLRVQRPGNVTVLHSTFANPTPGTDAAIIVLSGTVGVTNSIITSHTIGISLTAGTAWESHNLFYGNGANTASGVTAGGGSLTADPLFRNAGTSDYHLTAASPARELGVDAGINTDADSDTRPQGSGFDAGYDEFTEPPFKLYLPFLQR